MQARALAILALLLLPASHTLAAEADPVRLVTPIVYGTHLPAYVSDQGLGSEIAVIALTVVGVGNLIGT